MRKAISLLLVLCTVLALCGCGKARELTAEEREQIFYEVAAEKGLDLSNQAATAWQQTKDAMTEAPAPQSTLAPLYDAGPSPTDTDFICTEDMKLLSVGDGKYRPDMKIRCMYPEDALQVYPQSVQIHYNYLNNDNEIIMSDSLVVQHLAYNQSCWTNTGVVQGGGDSFDLSEISAIQVSYYEMRTVIGGRVSWQNEWDFLSPVKFNVADLEIEKA